MALARRGRTACRTRPRGPWLAGLLVLCLIVSTVVPSLHGAAQVGERPVVLHAKPGQVLSTAVHPFPANETLHHEGPTTLVELYTATWCPPCAPADRAIDRILSETPEQVAVLAYHPWPDTEGEDPFGIPEGQDRLVQKYDAFWFPSVYVGGIFEDAPDTRSTDVDAGLEELLYDSYRSLIERSAAIPDPYRMTTIVEHDGRNVTAHLSVRALAAVDGPLWVRGALWEDHIRFRGSNGIDDHRMTVRALTDRLVMPTLAAGETWNATVTLQLPDRVDVEDAGMTFFVEAPWEDPPTEQAPILMTYALGVGAAAGVAVFLMQRPPRSRRPSDDEPEAARMTKTPEAPTEPSP